MHFFMRNSRVTLTQKIQYGARIGLPSFSRPNTGQSQEKKAGQCPLFHYGVYA